MMMRFFVVLLVLFFPVHSLAQTSVVILNERKTEPVREFTKHDFFSPVFKQNAEHKKNGEFLNLFRENPGFALAGSAVLPGLSQAANRNWIRAGLFFAVEAASIALMIDLNQRARKGERNYENWVDSNWSVVQYSKWLIDYHDANGLDNPYLDELREMMEETNPAFNPQQDWQAVDLNTLRNVETNTRFLTPDSFAANNFSHTLPNYGSQQYYELVAKYYQYQAGWRDYNSFHDSMGHTSDAYNERFLIDRLGQYASPYFFKGAGLAEKFNDQYRWAGHFTSILIANHIFSAFDAYFTVSLKQNRLQATPSLTAGQQIRITYRF